MTLKLRISNVETLPDGGPVRYSVEGRGFEFGRDTGMDWTFPDPNRFVSSCHGEVRFENGGYWLYDRSTNGTFVNGSAMRVKSPYCLQRGDRIQVGSYIVLVEELAGPTGVPDIAQPSGPIGSPAAQPPAAADIWSLGASSAPPLQGFDPTPPPPRRGDFGDQHIEIPGFASPQNASPAPAPAPSAPAAAPAPAAPIDDSPFGPAATPPAPEPTPAPPAAEPAEPGPPPAFGTPAAPPPPFGSPDGPPPPFGAPDAPPPPFGAPDAPPPPFGAPDAPPPPFGAPDAPPRSPTQAEPLQAETPAAEPKQNIQPLEALAEPAPRPMPGANPLPPLSPPAPSPAPDAGPPPEPAAQAFGAPPPRAKSVAPPPMETPKVEQVPTPQPPPPAGTGGDAAALLRTVAKGAGLDADTFSGTDAHAVAHEIGRALRVMTAELTALLRVRTTVKTSFRSGDRTQLGRDANNPLKFIPSAEEALETMFGKPRPGYQRGGDAVQAAFTDIHRHQSAVFAAIQPALAEIIGDLAPESIEAKVEGSAFSSKNARAWELYVERWDAKTAPHENGMLDVFNLYFASNYDTEVRNAKK